MNTYKRHRFPPDIISYAVWLYYRFNLSHRDIEDLLAERGITVSSKALLQVLDEESWGRSQEDRDRQVVELSRRASRGNSGGDPCDRPVCQ